MKKKFIMPYQFGDVVEYIGDDLYWEYGTLHIISEVHPDLHNNHEYTTNWGAWFNHKDFKLIEKCSEKSIKDLIEDIEDIDGYEI